MKCLLIGYVTVKRMITIVYVHVLNYMLIPIHYNNLVNFNIFYLHVRTCIRIVDEVIECTVSMFSLSYANPTCLGPVHFIALLDPKATWFRRWMVRIYMYVWPWAGVIYPTRCENSSYNYLRLSSCSMVGTAELRSYSSCNETESHCL